MSADFWNGANDSNSLQSGSPFYNSSYSACDDQVGKITNFINDNLEPVLLPVHIALCVISSLVSLVNVYVLTRPCMLNCSLNVLLAALEVTNSVVSLLFLYNSVVLHSFPASLIYREHAFVQIFLLSVAWSAVAITVWMTAIIGTWRYIAVTRPLRAKLLLTRFRATCVVCCLAVVCCVGFSVHTFMSLKMKVWQHVLCNEEDFDPDASYMYSLGKRRWFYECVLIGLIFLVLPAIYSIITTACLVSSLVASVRNRQKLAESKVTTKDANFRTTLILTIMLFGFLVCNATPYLSDMLLWNALKITMPYPWKYLVDEFVPGLMMNIVSFFAYYNMGTKFRETFLSTLSSLVSTWDFFKPFYRWQEKSEVWKIFGGGSSCVKEADLELGSATISKNEKKQNHICSVD